MLKDSATQLHKIEELQCLLKDGSSCEVMQSTSRPTEFIKNLPVAESSTERPKMARINERSLDSSEEGKLLKSPTRQRRLKK